GYFGPGVFGQVPPSSTAFASTTPPAAPRSSVPGGKNGGVPPMMSPGSNFSPVIDTAAGAAASLDPQPCGAAPNIKVDSAFEVLGMQSPSSSQRPADQAERFIAALTGEKRSIPTWQGQPGSLRTWLKLLAHWETETSVPREKWGIRLYQSFQESSEPRKIADQVPLSDVLSARGYGLILSALMTKYKPYLDVAAPASIDRFFYAGERQKGQTFAAYIAGKEVSRQELETHLQESIPDRVAARILMRQALLTDYQREMMALKDANQLFSWSQVIAMLRPLDRPELIAQAATAELGATASKHYPVLALTGDTAEEEQANEEDEFWEGEEEEDLASDEEEMTFEDREYDEHEALYIHAYHSAYSDVRRDLQNRKKERGFVRHPRQRGESRGKGKGSRKGSRGSFSSRPGPSRFNKMIKGNADELMSRTRGSPGKQVNFVVCRGGVDQTITHAYVLALPLLYATVKVKAHEALVDTAAEDAVVGDRAFEAMRAELATLGPVRAELRRTLFFGGGCGSGPDCAGCVGFGVFGFRGDYENHGVYYSFIHYYHGVGISFNGFRRDYENNGVYSFIQYYHGVQVFGFRADYENDGVYSYIQYYHGDYADSLLVQDVINYQSAEDVITRIPMGRKMRNVMKPQGKQSGIVTFGLFAHGAMNGVTRSTQEMPQVCRFINRWIKSLAPSEFTWSSVTIGVQTTADVHMDAHNDGRSKNMSVTLGKFSQ
ncbi:unnamed protein product, partial [Symbiodinium sp. CCMP2456]